MHIFHWYKWTHYKFVGWYYDGVGPYKKTETQIGTCDVCGKTKYKSRKVW